MDKRFIRSALIFGESGIEKLNKKNVLVFGLGGVGSAVLEGLARGGIENFTIVDNDVYSISNINRQIFATTSSIGKAKTTVAKERLLDINPNIKVETINEFVTDVNLLDIDFKKFDYVVDAIDTISSKVSIIKKCKELKINIISAMGAGNRLSPEKFEVADIFQTSSCPLCKVMRKLLKENNVDSLKVVYSKEIVEPNLKAQELFGEKKGNGYAPFSVSFVPQVMGFIISGEVIKDLIKN